MALSTHALALGMLALMAWGAGCANHRPAFFPISDKTVRVGETLEFEVEAADADGDPLSFQIKGAHSRHVVSVVPA